jgi:hypothetical protein
MTQNTGLMAFWANIDPENWLEYQQWHNCQHIPERVAIEGFRIGRRYRLVADPSRFMMFYETQSPESLRGAGYLHALANPTAWSKKSLGWFRNGARSVYRRCAVTSEPYEHEAPLLLVIRYDADQDWAAHKSSTIRRVQQYVMDDSGTNVKTTEQSIHGAVPTSRRCLALAESEDSSLLEAARAGAIDLLTLAQAIGLPDGQSADLELYWLEIAIKSPNP